VKCKKKCEWSYKGECIHPELKTKCPKCGSEDCNDSGYFDHEFAGFKLTGKVLFCNHCGYERRELKLAGTPKIIASSEIIP
jgi:C4-type Zn-finger protein